ncbi:MAG: hypothetical protein PHX45_01170 [Acidobacteriota bacterium]|nr:hypothetical protein [Acidobacteriota bacterium]
MKRVALLLMVTALGNSAAASPGTAADRAPRGQVEAKPETPPPAGMDINLLKLLGVEASAESIDYIQNKTQFQLHTLLTEQRHAKTWNLREKIKEDTGQGLRMLFAVDDDVTAKMNDLASKTEALEEAARQIEEAVLAGNRIYVYGCGATGRLAKQMESTFWRPFWKKVKTSGRIWAKLKERLPEDIDERLTGEMTGADRALISSLEGFEDLQLIGRLQLEDHGVRKGDVVICVTEGGETSSVIGTILAALDEWKADPSYDPAASRKKLYFVYNNPDDRLLPFARSRAVLEEPGITKINLTTGPQAITGSTRMQATTSETYVLGTVLQTAAEGLLRRFLSGKEAAKIGFSSRSSIESRLREFGSVLEDLKSKIPIIARFTDVEAGAYSSGRFSTYFAGEGLVTVFIDSTERSPTFRLYPLDTVDEPARKCWIQVWSGAPDLAAAWRAFLGRPFGGLSPGFYQAPFEGKIDDPYLRRAALESLKKAGDDQQSLYDFSFSPANINRRGPRAADLGVCVLMSSEMDELDRPDSYVRRFIALFAGSGAKLAVILDLGESKGDAAAAERKIAGLWSGKKEDALVIPLRIQRRGDPFGLRPQIGLKMLLNAHSTAVMAKLGRVIGNTMTNVSPSNLKLIGRATYLIESHVNDILTRPEWIKAYGRRKPVSYGEANAVLFDSIAFLKDRQKETGQAAAEVAFSIIRIVESLRLRQGVTQSQALAIVLQKGLAGYLSDLP